MGNRNRKDFVGVEDKRILCLIWSTIIESEFKIKVPKELHQIDILLNLKLY